MIQGVLGELDPARKARDVPAAVEGEKEGSSSTPEKEDMEDGKTVSIVQIFVSPAKQSSVPVITDASLELAKAPPRDKSLVVVEESVPERDAGDLKALRPGEEARVTPSLGDIGASSFFLADAQ